MHANDRKALFAVALATVVGLALMVSGSTEAMTSAHPLQQRTRDLGFPASSEALFAEALEQRFGPHDSPTPPQEWVKLGFGQAPQLQRGRNLYRRDCLHCHGWSGAADTPTARILRPRPRDFSLGIVKYQSTPAGIPPTEADLAHTLRLGIPSTAMASFGALPDADQSALVDYTRFLLMRSTVELRVGAALQQLGRFGAEIDAAEREAQLLNGLDVAIQSVATEWANAEEFVTTPEIPESDPSSVQRGEQLFLSTKAGCWMCHGKDGSGKGPASWDKELGWLLRDVWGQEARPRDMARGQFHGGGDPVDLYRRIALGVEGTPMAPYADTLSSEEITDLVHYLKSLSAEERP